MASARRCPAARPDILCLSHVRWSFVYQRPHHVMSRFGRHSRVFFWEAPVYGATESPRLELPSVAEGVFVARPRLPAGLEPEAVDIAQRLLLHAMLREMDVRDYVLWYYTPLALRFTHDLAPAAVVYDCMDGLSGSGGAIPELPDRERDLLGQADLVFTGSRSLYEAKRLLHPRVHAFPTTVDVGHFSKARTLANGAEPEDQADLADVGRSRTIDAVLRGMSWDRTWSTMDLLLQSALGRRSAAAERFTLRRTSSSEGLRLVAR